MGRWARVRWWGKWIGVVACVAILVAWIASGWSDHRWVWPKRDVIVRLGDGCLSIDWGYSQSTKFSPRPGDFTDFTFNPAWSPTLGHWRLWFRVLSISGTSGERPGFVLDVPGWFFLVLTLVPTVMLWRVDARARRRALVNHCPKCGYDLAGLNAGSACPECGSNK